MVVALGLFYAIGGEGDTEFGFVEKPGNKGAGPSVVAAVG